MKGIGEVFLAYNFIFTSFRLRLGWCFFSDLISGADLSLTVLGLINRFGACCDVVAQNDAGFVAEFINWFGVCCFVILNGFRQWFFVDIMNFSYIWLLCDVLFIICPLWECDIVICWTDFGFSLIIFEFFCWLFYLWLNFPILWAEFSWFGDNWSSGTCSLFVTLSGIWMLQKYFMIRLKWSIAPLLGIWKLTHFIIYRKSPIFFIFS